MGLVGDENEGDRGSGRWEVSPGLAGTEQL